MGLEWVGLIGKAGILICELIPLARVCFSAGLGLCFGEGKSWEMKLQTVSFIMIQ